MQVLISDANILIDLEDGGILPLLFALPYQFKVPDLLFEQELREQHAHLLDRGLQVGELLPDAMEDAQSLRQKYVKTSMNDCFAVALARQDQCPLLTGDRALREAAQQEAVIVMGTLWVVEQMVLHQLIDKTGALAAYEKMKARARRLPWAEACQRINDLVVLRP